MGKNCWRKTLCVALAEALLAYSTLSLSANPGQQPLGQIVASSGASVGDVSVPNQGTVLAGDKLTTGPAGSALVKLSANTQITISGETTISFAGSSGHVTAKLLAGSILAQTEGTDALALEMPKCKVDPADPGKTTYLLS